MPFYQLAVDLAAALLIAAPVLVPLVMKGRQLPLWANVVSIVLGLVLIGAVWFALVNGHWPFRG